MLAYAAQMNRARGRPWQRRFGTKNTSFIEAILDKGATYHQHEIAAVEPDAVLLQDGTRIECDLIVACTGFSPDMPFLSHHPDLQQHVRQARSMYKHIFPPAWGACVAFCGFVRPGVGSIPPAAEMQARYLALVLSGAATLPSEDEMRHVAAEDTAADLAQYPDDAGRLGTLTGAALPSLCWLDVLQTITRS